MPPHPGRDEHIDESASRRAPPEEAEGEETRTVPAAQGSGPSGHVRVLLAARPSAVGEARRHLRHTLELAGLPQVKQHDALLLVSELVSNALKHGSREDDPIELVWRLERDTLQVAVLDAARAASALVALTPSEERPEGRGLRIVDQLADWWGERITGGRREVAFRLRLEPERPAQS
jgi:anti-sigma regulatory factor (Ser/Thr protein kinase)